jgi:23S rRNA (uracil1939-C5)-methyltransferase
MTTMTTTTTTTLPCIHAHECPGCSAIELSREAQAEAKTERVTQAVRHFRALDGCAIDTLETRAPFDAYRTRAKWVCDERGHIGLYRKGTHEVVNLVDCLVVRPAIKRVLDALRRLRIEGSRDVQFLLANDRILGLDVRETMARGEGALVTLTYRDGDVPSDGDLAYLEEALREAIIGRGSALTVSLSAAFHDGSPRTLGTYRLDADRLEPHRATYDQIGSGPLFRASPGSFIQAHRGIAAAIHDRVVAVLKELGPRPKVVELYAGSGSLALRLAHEGAHVTAVERFAPGIELALASAQDAGLASRFETVLGDASDVLKEGVADDADLLIVNPPRRGLSADVRTSIARSKAKKVVYIACDPDTLSRDLAVLARMGLVTTALTPFDMMPQTTEVETLAVLERGPAAALTILAEGPTWLAVAKDGHEPTTPHPEHPTSTQQRVQRRAGYERATPVHRLDVGTSGVLLFARTPEDVPSLQQALTAGQKTFLALVRGIPRAKGIIRRPLKEEGRMLDATSRYTRKTVIAGHGLVAVRPVESRLHQVRRHLAAISHPVVGDARYGNPPTNRRFEEMATLDRPFLHCSKIELELDGKVTVLSAPMPEDLALVIRRLG